VRRLRHSRPPQPSPGRLNVSRARRAAAPGMDTTGEKGKTELVFVEMIWAVVDAKVVGTIAVKI